MSDRRDCKITDVVVLCGREYLESELAALSDELARVKAERDEWMARSKRFHDELTVKHIECGRIEAKLAAHMSTVNGESQ